MSVVRLFVLAAICATPAVHASIFDFLPHPEVFSACLKTVAATLSRRAPEAAIMTQDVQPECEDILISAPHGPGERTESLMADCAELSGRIEEAARNGYLSSSGGAQFCGKVLQQSAEENQVPVMEYLPKGEFSRKKFCEHFVELPEVVSACAAKELAHMVSVVKSDDSSKVSPPQLRAAPKDAEVLSAKVSTPLLATPEKPEAVPLPQQRQQATTLHSGAEVVSANLSTPLLTTAEQNGVAAAEDKLQREEPEPLTEQQKQPRLTHSYMKDHFGQLLRWGDENGIAK